MTIELTRNDRAAYGIFHNWRVWVVAVGRIELRLFTNLIGVI